MKKLNLILIAASLISFSTYGQADSVNLPEPQYTGRIIFVNGNNAIPLEKKKASAKAKAGASMYLTGIGKVTGTNNIIGVKSPVRIAQAEKHQFIIRVSDNNIDPFQLLNIFKLEQKIKKTASKSYRFIETSSAETFSGSSAMDIGYIPFTAEKYGDYSFLITLTKPLAPGEYAMTLEGSRVTFNMFGID